MRLRYDERRQIGSLRLVVTMLGSQRVADLFGRAGRPQRSELKQIQDCDQTQELNFVHHFGALSRNSFHETLKLKTRLPCWNFFKFCQNPTLSLLISLSKNWAQSNGCFHNAPESQPYGLFETLKLRLSILLMQSFLLRQQMADPFEVWASALGRHAGIGAEKTLGERKHRRLAALQSCERRSVRHLSSDKFRIIQNINHFPAFKTFRERE